ncbi:hypothetical protein ACFZBE_37870 [Streptomyces sp. NPDC008061]|uniref:hypothetical protein n=1 Tax=Streptomyces sp. NPDC008061 TaxID=3364805 RepID=UPI0036E9B408
MSSKWYWWNEIERFSVAAEPRIGIVTRPKLMAPLQIVDGMHTSRPPPAGR